LTAFAEEFSVDVPARHVDGEYLIEYNQLTTSLVLGEDEWYQRIADYANANNSVFEIERLFH
jgi:hypothetical protein